MYLYLLFIYCLYFLGDCSKEVLSNDNILTELLEGDFGLESPNPCTSYQLKKVGFNSFHTLVQDLGYLYRWAQELCGIDFLAKQKKNRLETSDNLSQITVDKIIKLIAKRLMFRIALANQLDQLGKFHCVFVSYSTFILMTYVFS